MGSILYFAFIWGIVLTGVPPVRTASPFPGSRATEDTADSRVSPAEAERIIAERANRTLVTLAAHDMGALVALVHPVKGVRFSPYAFIDSAADRVVAKSRISGLWDDTTRYEWGTYDPSDEPILSTFREYYLRFVYDHDYLHAERVGFNDRFMGQGNTLNTIHETYPRGIVVEYHFPGFDPKFDGMDWSSLWLVFERQGSEWFLVGVVHGEWAI